MTPARRLPGATYHWKPSPRLRRLGWQNLRLGEDWDGAMTLAIEQNKTVARWLAANASTTTCPKRFAMLVVALCRQSARQRAIFAVMRDSLHRCLR